MNALPYPLQGQSPAISRVREQLRTAADTHWPILVTGPSGSGKQSAAEYLHNCSQRAKLPFVEANTACWNHNSMIHSVLFGHERGAFTGAVRKHPGLLEQAGRGTLFLDEIGDLTADLQAMLLKVIDQRQIVPVGAVSARPFQARMVCATHRDLTAGVREGWFRLDLLARLSPLQVRLPSLAERTEDLELLWRGLCQRHGIDAALPQDLPEEIAQNALADNLRGLERIAIQIAVWGKYLPPD